MPLDAVSIGRALDREFRASCGRLDRDEPWFGTYTAELGGRTVEYRIGNLMAADERIVDWRHPLARVFYETRPGDEFALDDPRFAEVEGTMRLRGQVASRQRSLSRIELADSAERAIVVLGAGGELVLEEDDRRPPKPEDGLPDIRSLLTPQQYALLTSSRTRPVVIQGRAGSGKTTVALYRVSWLTFPVDRADVSAEFAAVDPSNVLIVMFNRALRTFVGESLRPLGLADARLDTFHGWALDELRSAYKGEVEIDTKRREGFRSAAEIKKQLGVLRAIDTFVERQEARIDAWLAEKLTPYGASDLLEQFRAAREPVVRRLIALRTRARKDRDAASGRDSQRMEQVYKVLHRAVERSIQYKEELLRFFGDTDLLAAHLPDVPRADLEMLAAFQKEVQGERASERRSGPLVRFEDLALLLRLIQRKHGGYPNKLRDEEVRVYDHLVVDEAQDFGAVELDVLLSSVRSRTGVTIVGDVNQKIVPNSEFMGWDRLMAELGMAGAEVAALEVAHRSTRPIMALADALVGDVTGEGPPGPLPRLTRVADDASLVETVAELVVHALDESPAGHICVVVRNPKDAEPFQQALAAALPDERRALVRVGHNKTFRFDAGVTVTNLLQVKGLEFDTVIVIDPSAESYPDDDQGRRWLYTVLTRAKDRLELVSVSEPSPLIARAVETGLVEADRTMDVPEVEFDDDEDEPF